MTTPEALDCEIVITSGGAPAMLDRHTGEVMHPVVGPLVEAERLYLRPARLVDRLAEATTSPLVVFDVGLGAGSNAAAAFRAAHASPRTGRHLVIVSFDRSTAALELAIGSTSAPEFGFTPPLLAAARTLLDHGRCETDRVEWRFHEGDLPETLNREPERTADVVFWDPFSPRANPELWTLNAFARLRRACRARATVHTYSGATRVRSALLLAGFSVGFGAAISTDRSATVAATETELLARPLDRGWLERLRRSSVPFPVDAPPDALGQISALPQFR